MFLLVVVPKRYDELEWSQKLCFLFGSPFFLIAVFHSLFGIGVVPILFSYGFFGDHGAA